MIAREGISDSAAILAGATTLLVTGVKVVSYAYKEYELKKNKETIAEIEKLYKLHLEKIPVIGYKNAKMVKLPPIFDEGGPGEPKAKAVLQIDILEDLYKNIPIYSDSHLREYGHHVHNAMRKLVEFYDRRLIDRDWFHRGTKNDVTSAVLSYIILILSEHCIKFEGYSVDIAYLNSIAEFVNAFASSEVGAHHERFEQLTEAYCELLQAKEILIDHSTSLSMEELVCQFEADCSNASEKMIRLFSKLITPNNQWRSIDFSSMDHLAEGIVKPEYEYKNGNQRTIFSNAILLPNCLFSSWVKQAAKDYIASLPVTKKPDLPLDNKKFILLDLGNPSNKDALNKIKKVFKDSSNVLTTTVQVKGKNSATKEFAPVTTDVEAINRSAIYFDFYQLIDRMIVAQYFCSHIWREINTLGEKYVTLSHECDFIFQVLKGLGGQIDTLSDNLIKSLEKIESDSKGAMYRSQTHALIGELRTLLDCAKYEISPLINDIVEKHNARCKNDAAGNSQVHLEKEDGLLSLTHQISQAYGIDTGYQVILKTEHPGIPIPPPTNPANTHSVLETAKSKRRENKSINALYLSLYQMRRFGEELHQKDQALGKMVLKLVNDLEDNVDIFLGEIYIGKPMNEVGLSIFKKDFFLLLHSKDVEMAVHRAKWKPIMANIAIALTGIGLFVLMGKLIHSKLSTGEASLFFSQTRRQQQITQVDESLHKTTVIAFTA